MIEPAALVLARSPIAAPLLLIGQPAPDDEVVVEAVAAGRIGQEAMSRGDPAVDVAAVHPSDPPPVHGVELAPVQGEGDAGGVEAVPDAAVEVLGAVDAAQGGQLDGGGGIEAGE